MTKSDGHKKARLVAKGFSQVEGIDFDQIFSPVVQYESIHLLLAAAALEQWYIEGLNVKSAFLYRHLDEEIYMEQLEGFKIHGQERKVLHLHQAIYRLKQAALAWWKELLTSMRKTGFERSQSNAGIFIHKASNGDIVVMDINNRHSITGYFFKLARSSVSWLSQAQKTVALSSTKTEYMAISDCCQQAMWITNLFGEIGFPVSPITICGDNQGSLFISSNSVQEKQTKYIDIRYHYIRECIEVKFWEQLGLTFGPSKNA